MDLFQRIQAVLDDRRRDWPWLYKQLKVSKQAASNWRARGIPSKRQHQIADALDVSLDWLLRGQLDDARATQGPVKSTVLADRVTLSNIKPPMGGGSTISGLGAYASLVQVKGLARLMAGGEGMYEFAAAPDAGRVEAATSDQRAYALRVRGDELYPALRDGHYVVVEPSLPCSPGELVVLALADGRTMIGELFVDRPDAVVVGSAKGGSKRTFERHDLISIHPVTSIVAPSRWRQG